MGVLEVHRGHVMNIYLDQTLRSNDITKFITCSHHQLLQHCLTYTPMYLKSNTTIEYFVQGESLPSLFLQKKRSFQTIERKSFIHYSTFVFWNFSLHDPRKPVMCITEQTRKHLIPTSCKRILHNTHFALNSTAPNKLTHTLDLFIMFFTSRS